MFPSTAVERKQLVLLRDKAERLRLADRLMSTAEKRLY